MSILQQNVSLQTLNTFGIPVSATHFAEVRNADDLKDIFSTATAKSNHILVLGGGSNWLFTKDFDGLVIKMNIPGIKVETHGADVLVTAGAGVIWNDLVNYCVENGFAGIENLALIPGTVGASPIQNIGAYGVELKDVFKSCTAFEIAKHQTKTFDFEACKFGYRESVFKNELKGKYIITEVVFQLSTKAKLQTHYGAIAAELEQRNIQSPTIKDIAKVVADIRVSKLPDPKTIGNAGSFFKNPMIDSILFTQLIEKFPTLVNYPLPDGKVKLAAGWLIEQCGFKGMIHGHTGTWKNQALVLVNHGGATGQEVYAFSEQIIKTVNNKFGVLLEREVNVW